MRFIALEHKNQNPAGGTSRLQRALEAARAVEHEVLGPLSGCSVSPRKNGVSFRSREIRRDATPRTGPGIPRKRLVLAADRAQVAPPIEYSNSTASVPPSPVLLLGIFHPRSPLSLQSSRRPGPLLANSISDSQNLWQTAESD
ncbi:hypothetical protein AX14_013011 [Amanita brunnescens Koide BX004]|nr:hypothetical protein AX14_013011 [Amanita brunnescens Koide BX004]